MSKSSADAAESLDLVTEVARKRREDAKRRVLEEPPSFILDVRASEVQYGFHPRALPYQLADFAKFRKKLDDEYKLKFKVPDVVPEIMDHLASGASRKKLDMDSIGRYLFQMDEPRALFQKGRLDMGQRKIVQIDTLLFGIEDITVKVRGKTDAAELLIKDVVQYLWAAASIERSWEELEPDVQAKTFGTSTRVKLGFPPERLFSGALNSFLSDQVISGHRFGREMGRLSDRDKFAAPPISRESYMLDELQVRVSRYDEIAGQEEAMPIRIGVGRRDLYGYDIVDCDTALSYSRHCEFVKAFIDVLKGAE